MHFEIEVGGRMRKVTVTRTGAAFAVDVDGHTRHVDAAPLDAHTLSLIVDKVWPHDVVIVPERPGQLTVTINGTTLPVVSTAGDARGPTTHLRAERGRRSWLHRCRAK